MQTAAYKRNQPIRALSFVGAACERDWSQTGRIVRRETIANDPNWFVVKFDSDGGKLCVHASRLMPNSAPAG